MILLLLISLMMVPAIVAAEPQATASAPSAESVRTAPLTIEEVFARIELTHPLLRATGLERAQARAKVLKALGAWEPKVRNEVEVDRYVTYNLTNVCGIPNDFTAGYSDTMLKVAHPWGIEMFGGIRNGFGDRHTINSGTRCSLVAFPQDLQAFWPQQMLIVGGAFNLLRGFMVNDEYAEFQQAELAGPQAEVKVAQKRQDLYLAGAIQYWDWQVAVKQADVVKRALAVAEERYRMVEGRSKAGAVAPIDVVEAQEEVQRRREAAIAAQRKVEYEQYKLALFLWKDGEPVTPRPEWAPEFQGETPLPSEEDVAVFKVEAAEDRPEVRDLYIEARLNNIEVKLAKNGLLPKLTFSGGPAVGSLYWIGGFGYNMQLRFSMPLFNRGARGKVLHAEAEQTRLAYKQAYTERQVEIDVDNWLSAIVRARDRVKAATEGLRLAKTLEEGERARFNMGATSVLFVNLRERAVVEAAYELYRAQADYAVARGGMLWARGALSKPLAENILAKYGDPVAAAGISGRKLQGRD
ncbi:MAG: putative Outer membrane efflux protein [Candidatus Nitrospira kreftii]|uniref:Putative Outer membrane efflux protein n=1 Tax=Candidatus Nitrospira kreftii TaxID=2652173 RepID=A0A7S8FBA6_9BACT|nr:MAG: putative Outer membrane efflux protein [Candidatus Nitrospira kreftii]